MIELLLFVIVLILLFGSSALVGMIGWVIGFIVAAVGLAYFSITYDIEPFWILIFGAVGFIGICTLILVSAKILEPYEIARIERRLAQANGDENRDADG